MRLERLILSGFSPAFPGVVDLPFRDLGPGVYAVVGENGAGKTTLLETVPGAIYRSMPSADGADPVTYATTRESYLDLEYAFDGLGLFRSRLNLDGPKRQTDAVLEQLLPDGMRVPLNDGKRSTYDEAIKTRFPSFDLFVNSSFAAQGRGDEFTRRPPSKRKDLFVELLALAHLAEKAKKASEAADLCSDAKLRLQVVVEQLAAHTAPGIAEALERYADQLQTDGLDTEIRQRELKASIADLETRLALLADQVAANAAASERVQTLARELAGRQGERGAVSRQREAAVASLSTDRARIIAARDVDVADADKRIAGNEQILKLADAIREAVDTVAEAEQELQRLRADASAQQTALRQAEATLRQVEKAIAALVPVEQRLARSTHDAGLLETVPCGGTGGYADCQFLTDAAAAKAQIAALQQELGPKAALADQVAAATRDVERLTGDVRTTEGRIAAVVDLQTRAQKNAQYKAPLAEATAKIAGYKEARAKAQSDADRQLGDAQQRRDNRLAELDAQAVALDAQIATLTRDHARADADLAATAAGNTQATVLQAQLAEARAEWDRVTATIATVANGREELSRRHQALEAARARLADVRQRQARVDQELVEWRDLAKALSKGGLPDLEMDVAGPGLSATANVLLQTGWGSRFSMELVTQVAKVDGSGLRDEFTVLCVDNEKGGDWRDIKRFSGGERTILQEALMCAICLYVNERSPMPIRTLWRDETGAALSTENAIRYTQMLRKVQQLGSFHHIFFISHTRDAAAIADGQIQVGNGTAVIVYPPYAEVA